MIEKNHVKESNFVRIPLTEKKKVFSHILFFKMCFTLSGNQYFNVSHNLNKIFIEKNCQNLSSPEE